MGEGKLTSKFLPANRYCNGESCCFILLSYVECNSLSKKSDI